MGELSAGDIMALTKENGGGFLEGNGIIILLLFLLFMGGGFGGFAGNNAAAQGALTRAEMQDAINGQNITNSLNNIMLANNNGFNSINSNIAQLGFNMQQCCCDIKTTVSTEAAATRQLINNNTMQDLRDKLADKDRELNSAIFAASQLTQTRTLEDFILANK